MQSRSPAARAGCVMVDIDADVVKFCKENFPENAEAFADPRLDLIIDDAKARRARAVAHRL